MLTSTPSSYGYTRFVSLRQVDRSTADFDRSVRSVFRRRIYTKTRVHPNVVQTRRLSLEVRTSANGFRNETCTIESSVSTYEVSPFPMGLNSQLPGIGAARSSTKDLVVRLPPLNTQLKMIEPRRKCTGMCVTSPTIRQNVVSCLCNAVNYLFLH